ncbi:MAG: glycosyltransferase family A protein [Pseudomonadota bacterium]
MSGFDITVALTLHNETVVAGPTLHSCDAAIAAAEAAGHRVERIIGLDNATEATWRFVNQSALDHWRKVPLSVGDLGLARNGLAEVARGTMLAFMDADDLFSENWLVEGARMLTEGRADGIDRILHPELNWFFDGAGAVLVNPDIESPFYAPQYWRVGNCYDSLAMADTDTFRAVPYRARDKASGYGFEDWAWNVETLQAGYEHRVVRDTIIFKRRRDNSLVTELKSNKSVVWELEGLAIDELSRL